MKVGIIGLGVVGSALKFGFEKLGHKVFVYDKKFKDTKIEDLMETDLIFICVPTPNYQNGHCDLSNVHIIANELNSLSYKGLVVVKSTVPPKTTDQLSWLYKELRFSCCPEFLRERCSISDFCENLFLVCGVYNDGDFELLRKVHGHFPRKIFKVRPIEAELIKYFHNIYNMLRIVFANEFYEVCEFLDVDYMKVKNIAIQNFLASPNFYLDCSPSWRGAGGPCLPKDTLAFAAFVRFLGIRDLKLFEFLYEENKKFQVTVPEGMRKE